ncbi:c-type cytochrome [Rhodomicrobium lacus]|uniref:c-type cytochrome n=1 Tax=Rhodomicrobium lacus TaxID=2498452 RepID=UPI000F8DDF3C|nr:c-type cytochrome [Rhodomicrobium lacus]
MIALAPLKTALPAALFFLSAVGASLAAPDDGLIERGKYLATIGDCAACHTRQGGEPFAGGLQIQTPFGSVTTPNITPDKRTGIGEWTEDEFYRALHEGIGKHGQYLYPVFPFTSFTKVRRDDVNAIRAYLMSLKPVHAPREANSLAFPFDIRETLSVWRGLFFVPGVFEPDPARSEQVNWGAYLVEGLGHCGQCHTQRNLMGATIPGDALQGAAVQGWFAPNITADMTRGIGSWSEQQLVSYLASGVAPMRSIAEGPMATVVHDSLSKLKIEDLRSIAAYLKQTPPRADVAGGSVVPVPAGAAGIYVSNCASCHGLDGEGFKDRIPPLSKNGTVNAEQPQDIIKAVLAGLPATQQYGPMPSFAAYLSDGDIAAVANYVRSRWGNNAPTDADSFLVREIRQSTPIMLAGGEGSTQCPPPLNEKERVVMDKAKAEAGDLLRTTQGGNLVLRIREILPKVRAAVHHASEADIVNGLTAAFCPVVADRETMTVAQKRNLLDIFAQITYAEASGMLGRRPSRQ